ncbi:hypothetical protein M427DRAFT_156631 [Gonapodya prolifera JEL478]|uniref:F-box domain-containing protein n=1 Tax=Gonapodya prolifera (strain JEL478) TaxID=1344416 RepID=A0A139A9X1_GONPJ|nr:hypothetical protein M427DRAFT_156631 [Gonapodya prolifera JEL478]|eukprot:KXS13530.1 hypothetical protein M427DRAFT_156631 [Gonapodya prolifera JEL478]
MLTVFPLEIIHRIVDIADRNSDRRTLSNLRLVCRALDEIATPKIFRQFEPRSGRQLGALVKVFKSWKDAAERIESDVKVPPMQSESSGITHSKETQPTLATDDSSDKTDDGLAVWRRRAARLWRMQVVQHVHVEYLIGVESHVGIREAMHYICRRGIVSFHMRRIERSVLDSLSLCTPHLRMIELPVAMLRPDRWTLLKNVVDIRLHYRIAPSRQAMDPLGRHDRLHSSDLRQIASLPPTNLKRLELLGLSTRTDLEGTELKGAMVTLLSSAPKLQHLRLPTFTPFLLDVAIRRSSNFNSLLVDAVEPFWNDWATVSLIAQHTNRFIRLPKFNSKWTPQSLIITLSTITNAHCVFYGPSSYFRDSTTFTAFFSNGTLTNLILEVDGGADGVDTEFSRMDMALILRSNSQLRELRLYSFRLKINHFFKDLQLYAERLEHLTIHTWGLTEERVEQWLQRLKSNDMPSLRKIDTFSAVYGRDVLRDRKCQVGSSCYWKTVKTTTDRESEHDDS